VAGETFNSLAMLRLDLTLFNPLACLIYVLYGYFQTLFGQITYKNLSLLPIGLTPWLRDNLTAPWHSLLTPVIFFVGVLLLKEPPVIDGQKSH
jgi:hypothetical protein